MQVLLQVFLCFGFFFFKGKSKKEITIQTLASPNLALLRKGNFPEPPPPPGGPILLSGMSVRIQSSSADCRGVVAAKGGSSLGAELLVSLPEMEQSSQQSSLRARSLSKGHNQQKDPILYFKNSSFLLSPVLL